MPDQSHFIGGGTTDSVLSPIVLVGMLIGILLMLLLPRRFVIVPFLLCIFLIPLGQQIYLGGVHWLVGRILVLAGLLKISISKVGSKGNFLPGGYNSIDRAFLWCTLAESICVVLQYMQSQALINQFGFLIDYLGAYFLLRALIQDKKDIYTAIKCMALLSVILAFFMVREQQTLHNAFGTLGGVQSVPDVREGKTRSQGVFQHALMAGTFAASLLPLFLLLGKNGKSKLIAFIGIAGCTVMTITSQSSTPLLAYVGGLGAVFLWPVRKKMQLVRRGIVAALLGLAVVMKAPVWFVIAHIDLTGGSSGYHRAELIDVFIKHFSDWWLIGTKDIASWGFDMWDTQNQYVNVGETGGLVAFILFVCMISRCFARIGVTRTAAEGRSSRVWFVWFLGAALLAHLVSFFGVNYFDQSKVNWFLLLAMISAATAPTLVRTVAPRKPAAITEPEPADVSVSRWETSGIPI
jgi:phosphate starvation-inducible membrane PsiE